MKAVVITPGRGNSLRLMDVDRPHPGPGEVLVRVREAGIDGTDLEINSGSYGEAPQGWDFLILGHESLGQVEEGVQGLQPGDYVVAIVRRPDDCLNCRNGQYDMCLTGNYRERGIKGLHGFLAEYYAESPEYLVKVPQEHQRIGILLEPASVVEKAVSQLLKIQERMLWEPQRALVLGAGPIGLLATAFLRLRGLETYTLATGPVGNPKARLAKEIGAAYIDVHQDSLESLPQKMGNLDIIIEATGNSSVAFQAMSILGTNGVLCLTGVSAGHGRMEIRSDDLNLGMVLGNKTVFGTVNANRSHFEEALAHLGQVEARWPGWLSKLITRRIALEDFKLAFQRARGDIKTVVEVSAP